MFVHALQTCQRLPELALFAGAVLSCVAAMTPPTPTGWWDRHPHPTAGRLRRVLAHTLFPADFPFPARFCRKKSRTAHLHTGFWFPRAVKTASDAPCAA